MLKPRNLELLANQVEASPRGIPENTLEDAPVIPFEEKNIEELFNYKKDPFPDKIITSIKQGTRHSKDISLAEFEIRNGRLYYRERLWVSDLHESKMRLYKEHHDSVITEHPDSSYYREIIIGHVTTNLLFGMFETVMFALGLNLHTTPNKGYYQYPRGDRKTFLWILSPGYLNPRVMMLFV